jgi:hypothetical protein
MTAPVVDLSFAHDWQAQIVPTGAVTPILRRYFYPREVDEVERGALEVVVRPRDPGAKPFLATCALGFRDPAVPMGIWSCPRAQELCAVAGGYAYLIDTTAPDRFTMIDFRPVLEVRPAVDEGLLLFVGHHAVLAWGCDGLAWQSEKLSDEGVTITAIETGVLHGQGWSMITDKDTPFALDLRTGQKIP